MQKGLLFIVLLFFALGLNAQEIPEQRFEAGLIAGFNMSQLDGDDLIGFHKIGINTGGRVSARLSKRLRLNMEMLFSQQGSSYATTDNPSAPIDKGNFKSGYALVEDKKIAVINKFFDTEARINSLLEILSGFEVDKEQLTEESAKFFKEFQRVIDHQK